MAATARVAFRAAAASPSEQEISSPLVAARHRPASAPTSEVESEAPQPIDLRSETAMKKLRHLRCLSESSQISNEEAEVITLRIARGLPVDLHYSPTRPPTPDTPELYNLLSGGEDDFDFDMQGTLTLRRIPNKPARRASIKSAGVPPVVYRLYDKAMEHAAPSFRELHERTIPEINPSYVRAMVEQEREIARQSGKEITRRNKAEIDIISGIMKGELDNNTRFQREREHAQGVRQKRQQRMNVSAREVQAAAMQRQSERSVRATTVEDVDNFIFRLASWMVILKVYQAADAVNKLLNTEVKDQQRAKKLWAVSVICRNVPVQMRKRLRARRLRLIYRDALCIIFIVKLKRNFKNRTIQTVRSFFRSLMKDRVLKLHAFMHHALVCTKAIRGYLQLRKHQTNLVLKQWRAIETVLLLTRTSKFVAAGELAGLPMVQRWYDARGRVDRHDAVPVELRPHVREPYFVYLARWRQYSKKYNIAVDEGGLPLALSQQRVADSVVKPIITKHISIRSRKMNRTITSTFVTYQQERQSANDMLIASKKLRREAAINDALRKYPSVNPETKLFKIIVEFEESYAPSPFYAMLIGNAEKVLRQRLPPAPHIRTLMLSGYLESEIERCLERRGLHREMRRLGGIAEVFHATD